MGEVTIGVGALLEHSGVALLSPLGWATGIASLSLVGLLMLWFTARRRGWLAIHTGSAWPRRLTLAIWLLVLTPLAGAAGFIYGAERATLGILDETRVIERSCGVLASGMILAIADDGAERIPVTSLHALWTTANDQVRVLRDQKIREAVDSQLDPGVTADAAHVVGRWGAELLQRELVGGPTDAVDGVLAALAAKAAADGTVGAAEAGVWLSERYVMPRLRDLLIGLFRPYYFTLSIFIALGVAAPLGLAGLSRRRRPAPR